ncbi:hypothetical protein BLA29_005790 [Euroglyphus maynei]|uniref:Uncharacterized protein n=1 Tax=Euroglyphus maynei TaxID=6958 RepID=A0A1Y3AXL8_EURMA|nr:hypothetical protein BLA29_005790 [Euroglyphus maynei]
MSLYCTLPRRNRRSSVNPLNTNIRNNENIMINNDSHGWICGGLVSSTTSFAKPRQCFNTNTNDRSSLMISPLVHYGDGEQSCRHSIATGSIMAPISEPNAEYLNFCNTLHYKNHRDSLCSNQATLPTPTSPNGHLSSWTSFNCDHYDSSRVVNNFHPMAITTPTETSDTVTFTESATSTFDEYSSNSGPTTKLYYACDSIQLPSQSSSSINNNNRLTKPSTMPNFYGTIDEDGLYPDDEDDDEEEEEEEDLQSSNEDFITGASVDAYGCSVEDITEVDEDQDSEEDYIDELERQQREHN